MRVFAAFKVAMCALSLVSVALAADCNDTTIEALLPKIAGHNPWQQQDAARQLVRHGRPAVPPLVKMLADPGNDVRAWAAYAIREILAADPQAATNDHGQAYWQQQISRSKMGMTMDEVRKLLPDNGGDPGYGGGGSGEGVQFGQRLDDYWIVHFYFWAGLLREVPELERRVVPVQVAFPKDFSGTWTTWYINGQKCEEMELREGKFHGVHYRYFDNGRKAGQYRYEFGEPNGLGIGWHRNGRKSSEGAYVDGKQVGTWTHWYENGQPFVVESYKAGKLDGLSITWYSNGVKEYEREYREGVEDGIDRAWDESGKLLWDR